MPRKIRSLPVFLLLLIVASTGFRCSVAGTNNNSPSIHDILRANGLPGGLVPKSDYISSFSLDEQTGLLSINLTGPCYARYADTSLAYFDNFIAGNLTFGALIGVEGLEQEELFVWLPVKGIIEEQGTGVILFDIGLAHKRLSRSLFEDPPDCQASELLSKPSQGYFGRRGGPHEERYI